MQEDYKEGGRQKSYKVVYQVLRYATKSLTNVLSAVFNTKLRPRFIRVFTVIAKKFLVYTLNLPCKLRTETVFYVAFLI